MYAYYLLITLNLDHLNLSFWTQTSNKLLENWSIQYFERIRGTVTKYVSLFNVFGLVCL